MTASFDCGDFLDCCTCRLTGPVALSRKGMRLRHEASVERAQRSDAGRAPQLPTENMRGRQRTAQASVRPSLRDERAAA